MRTVVSGQGDVEEVAFLAAPHGYDSAALGASRSPSGHECRCGPSSSEVTV